MFNFCREKSFKIEFRVGGGGWVGGFLWQPKGSLFSTLGARGGGVGPNFKKCGKRVFFGAFCAFLPVFVPFDHNFRKFKTTKYPCFR